MTTSNIPAITFSALAEEVLSGLGLSPKKLPPKLFYDAHGSRLFEKITQLPEYYLTRVERAIFEQYANEILAQAGTNLTLVELGAGNASKTRILVEALARRQLRVRFYPVDVSAEALNHAVSTLNGRIPPPHHAQNQEPRAMGTPVPNLRVHPLVADYSQHVPLLRTLGHKLVLFIGSTIGNFDFEEAVQFLKRVRDSLRTGDAMLLGFDMVKSAELLHAAYNDRQGVTAEFNKNVLARINRELGGQFDLETFEHIAFWNPEKSRIEMHLESRVAQKIWVRDLGKAFEFSAGERIHTENSYKFTPASIANMLQRAGFVPEKAWMDENRWFSTVLARLENR
jgi:L-histidine Nalpha-methyltransferase